MADELGRDRRDLVLARGRQRDDHAPTRTRSELAPHQAGVLGAVDELDHGALRARETLAQLGERRSRTAVPRRSDHQQQGVALEREPARPRDPLALALERQHRLGQTGSPQVFELGGI